MRTMKLRWLLVAVFCCWECVQAQDSCQWCFYELDCDGPDEGYPDQDCWNCLRSECESELTLRHLAPRGMNCLSTKWLGGACSSDCPTISGLHIPRMINLTACLTSCVEYAVENGVGQCRPQIPSDFTVTPGECVAKEVSGECGSCYRYDLCFSAEELEPGCKAHLDAQCPGSFDATCMTNAWQDAGSMCPAITNATRDRLSGCGTCLGACDAIATCLKGCEDLRPPFPIDVPCALCRAICAGTPDPTACEANNCDCAPCDECVVNCTATHGSSFFSLLDPCKCLERVSPFSQTIAPRILGGAETCQGDYPFMAYLYLLAEGRYDGFVCGGALITDEWVLTAAHCIQTIDLSLYGVVLGELDRATNSCAEQVFGVSRLEIHPSYNPAIFQNDIALIKLSGRATINRFVMPVNVVANGTRTDDNASPTFAGETCYTVGWGATSSPNGQASDVLLELSKTITPESICQFLTTQNSGNYSGIVVAPGDPKFCAGSTVGEDTCEGDSGGPLVCMHDNNQLYVHGLTSYGTEVCGVGLPGIYTKVADLRPWIDGIVD